MNDRFILGLYKTLIILRDYLSEIVVGGGWAPFLYDRYLFKNRHSEPVFTRDIDFMVKPKIPIIGQKTVDRLLVEAGLMAKFKSRENPPVIHYEGTIEGSDVEIEFLTNQTGSKSDAVLKVQDGLHAEALRYVSLLVENILVLTIDDTDLMNAPSPLTVKVPTPAAYIFQKGLIFKRRRNHQKRAKDLYYIFDILAGSRETRHDLVRNFSKFRRKHAKWYRTFMAILGELFEGPGSEGVLLVTEQRPTNAYVGLDDSQFQHYAFGIFEAFIKTLR